MAECIPLSLPFSHSNLFLSVHIAARRLVVNGAANRFHASYKSMTNLAISQFTTTVLLSRGALSMPSPPTGLHTVVMTVANRIVNTSILRVPFIPTQALQRLYQWHNYRWLPNMIAFVSPNETASPLPVPASRGRWGAFAQIELLRTATAAINNQQRKIKRCFQ